MERPRDHRSLDRPTEPGWYTYGNTGREDGILQVYYDEYMGSLAFHLYFAWPLRAASDDYARPQRLDRWDELMRGLKARRLVHR